MLVTKSLWPFQEGVPQSGQVVDRPDAGARRALREGGGPEPPAKAPGHHGGPGRPPEGGALAGLTTHSIFFLFVKTVNLPGGQINEFSQKGKGKKIS